MGGRCFKLNSADGQSLDGISARSMSDNCNAFNGSVSSPVMAQSQTIQMSQDFTQKFEV